MSETLDLSQQFADDSKLATRKKLHRIYSINNIDMQEEAFRRIGDATSVLDIGCGVGEVLINLRLGGFKGRLKGVDKYDILKKGVKLSEEYNLNIEFEQIDISKQADPSNWDVGIMVSILCFVPEYRDVIRNYSKVCKKIVMVDTGFPEAYPWLAKTMTKELEKVFNLKSKTLAIGFTIHDAIIEFMKYYETINIQKLDDAFRFTDASPMVEYFNTCSPDGWIPEPSEEKWEEMLDYVRVAAQKKMETNEVWIEPKPYYVVTAENPTLT